MTALAVVVVVGVGLALALSHKGRAALIVVAAGVLAAWLTRSRQQLAGDHGCDCDGECCA